MKVKHTDKIHNIRLLAAFVFSLSLASLTSCNKKESVEIPPPPIGNIPQEEIDKLNNEVNLPPISTPTPAPKQEIVSPKEKTEEYFSDNKYVLIRHFQHENSDGIVGFPPGTVVIKQNNKFVTSDGTILDVKENDITNNIEIARRVVTLDKVSQFNLKKVVPTPVPQSNQITNSTPSPIVPPAFRGGSSLEKGSYNRRGQGGWSTDENGKKYKIEDGRKVYID